MGLLEINRTKKTEDLDKVICRIMRQIKSCLWILLRGRQGLTIGWFYGMVYIRHIIRIEHMQYAAGRRDFPGRRGYMR